MSLLIRINLIIGLLLIVIFYLLHNNLLMLIASLQEHPVVSGLYKAEDAVNYFAVEKIDLDYFANNGSFKFISQQILISGKLNKIQNIYL